MSDDIKHKGEELVGKAKEAAGGATGNERLEAEGKSDQGEAKLKQAGDKAKDALKNVKDALS